jgi:hypothetical protein
MLEEGRHWSEQDVKEKKKRWQEQSTGRPFITEEKFMLGQIWWPSVWQRLHRNCISFKHWSHSDWLWLKSKPNLTLNNTTQHTSWWPACKRQLLRDEAFCKPNRAIFYFIHLSGLSRLTFLHKPRQRSPYDSHNNGNTSWYAEVNLVVMMAQT